jgi:putative transposase
MREIHKNHVVHQLGYHLVFCTKYRNPVLTQAVGVYCKKIIAEICKDNNWLLHSIEVMPDHVHLFLQIDHQTAPVVVVKILKACSTLYLFEKFKDLKARKFWGSGLWSSGCYYATVGSCTEEAVKKYIDCQKKNNSSQG